MALTAEQLVIVSEITQETYATIVSLESSLSFNESQEAWIVDDVDLWEGNRNKLKVELDGDVKFKTRLLLDDIRVRTRNAFGLPLYSEQTYPTSGAVANRFVF